jgi:hypothetical protein
VLSIVTELNNVKNQYSKLYYVGCKNFALQKEIHEIIVGNFNECSYLSFEIKLRLKEVYANVLEYSVLFSQVLI